MFCSKCGSEVGEYDVFCGSCGNQLRAVFKPLNPQNKAQTTTQVKPQSASQSWPKSFGQSRTQPVSQNRPQTTRPQTNRPVSQSKPQPAQQIKPQPVQETKPQTAPQPVQETKPQPVPQPVQEIKPQPAPQPVQEMKQVAAVKKEAFTGPDGKLTWFYRDLEKDPSGKFVVKYIFEDDFVACYNGIDLNEQILGDAEVSMRYYYKRVTVVQRHEETGWIYFRHGIDRYFLQVNPEQYDAVLAEFMKRCPDSKMGIVKVW